MLHVSYVIALIALLLSVAIIYGSEYLYEAVSTSSNINTSQTHIDAGDTYCTNLGSSLCDSIVVTAKITGSSDQDSYGTGSATGDALLGGSCCVAGAEVQKGYYDTSLGISQQATLILWLDGSTVSHTFYHSGDIVYTSAVLNMCDNVEPSVAASLDGTCSHS